ncbi:hypothetical protein BSK56_05240 [Paenibacillus borealis]|uniref:Glycosyltransferase 2-like domain-containing protein n=1 Tax=Paenibacillus borealis TaxID=160799 RepID=A0ABX3HKR7_PAEBO|nr:glycosyltransferase family A protein [Paenibacillus borealis]OMD51279.1 hypothetical protein BSK56_05240 [Paenibacillus borealis]
MVAQLIWIAVIYGSAVVLVHILRNRELTRQTARSGKRLHYILITRNHEAVVEWYIRVIGIHAFLTGKLFRVTVMDDDSSDDTIAVASRLAYSGSSIDVARFMHNRSLQAESPLQQGILVDLRFPGTTAPLPFMRMPESGGYQSERGE